MQALNVLDVCLGCACQPPLFNCPGVEVPGARREERDAGAAEWSRCPRGRKRCGAKAQKTEQNKTKQNNNKKDKTNIRQEAKQPKRKQARARWHASATSRPAPNVPSALERP